MIVFLWAIAAAMGLIVLVAIIAFVVAVKMGLLNDPDGKESNPEYWKALKRSNYDRTHGGNSDGTNSKN